MFSHSIHPRYKQDVADRLTLGARSVAYGEGDVVFQGPFPSAVLRLATEELLVEFNDGNVVLSMNNVSGFDVRNLSFYLLNKERWSL